MIIVSSLDQAVAAFAKYQPAYVISILDTDEPTPPAFDNVASGNHLKLIGNCTKNNGMDCAGELARCHKILDIAEKWKNDETKPPIMIHCHEGAARSMAVAYILMCAIEGNQREEQIAARLRDAAPHADPNLLLIAEGDKALGRDDRMVEAILDLSPCCSANGTSIVTLPITP